MVLMLLRDYDIWKFEAEAILFREIQSRKEIF